METILAWSKCSALVLLLPLLFGCPRGPCLVLLSRVRCTMHGSRLAIPSRVAGLCRFFLVALVAVPPLSFPFALLCLESGMNIWLTFPLLLLCFYCGTEYKRNVRVKLNEWKVKCFHSCKQTRNIFERELNLPSIGPNTHTYVISNRRWWNVISWSTLRCESFYATFDLILLPCMISFAKTWTRF